MLIFFTIRSYDIGTKLLKHLFHFLLLFSCCRAAGTVPAVFAIFGRSFFFLRRVGERHPSQTLIHTAIFEHLSPSSGSVLSGSLVHAAVEKHTNITQLHTFLKINHL